MKSLIPICLVGALFALLAIAQEPVKNMDSALAVPGQVPVAGVNGATWGNQFQVNFNFTNSTIASGPNRTRIGAGFTMWSNNPSSFVVITNGAIAISGEFNSDGNISTLGLINCGSFTTAGNVFTDGQFQGDGSGINSLNANELTSGTIPGARYGARTSPGISGPFVTTNGSGTSVLSFNAASLTNYGGIKVYRALLTQASTAAPSATVLENTLGGTVVWARSVAGVYTATLSGAFTSNKTVAECPANVWSGSTTLNANYLVHTSANVLTLTTVVTDVGVPASDAADDLLNATKIEVLVYP